MRLFMAGVLVLLAAGGAEAREPGPGYQATADEIMRIAAIGHQNDLAACEHSRRSFGVYLDGGAYFAREEANRRASAKIPGTSYDCWSRTGRIVSGSQEWVFQGGTLVAFSSREEVVVQIGITQESARVAIDDGKGQSVTFFVNRRDPAKSQFTDAALSVRGESSGTRESVGVDSSGGKRRARSVSKNTLIGNINSAYAEQAGRGASMFHFAVRLVSDEAERVRVGGAK